jgi:hypothetical protein
MDETPAAGDDRRERLRSLRIRSALERWFTVVAAVLVVLAVVGGWVTYGVYVDPGYETEQRQVSSWQRSAAFGHGSTVTSPNPVFPVGAELTDRPFYYRSLTPVLNGTFAFGYTASDAGSLSLTVDVRLVVRAVSSEEGEGGTGQSDQRPTEFWRVERELANDTLDGVPPGERTETSFAIDVPALGNRTQRITERLGGTPGTVETSVQATVRGSGTVNGRDVDARWTYELPITIEDNVYRVADPGPVQASEERTETVRVERTYGPLRRIGAPLVSLAALAALAVLGRRRFEEGFDLDPAERELLAFHDDREEFDEWIVAVDPPEEVHDLPRAEARSLGDLVDFAIDTDNSVLEPPSGEEYLVVHEGYLYAYRPPSPGSTAGDPALEPLEESAVSDAVDGTDAADETDAADGTGTTDVDLFGDEETEE